MGQSTFNKKKKHIFSSGVKRFSMKQMLIREKSMNFQVAKEWRPYIFSANIQVV